MTDLYLSLEHPIWITCILDGLNTSTFVRLKWFYYKPIPNNAEFTFMEKSSENIYFAFKKRIPRVYLMTLVDLYLFRKIQKVFDIE